MFLNLKTSVELCPEREHHKTAVLTVIDILRFTAVNSAALSIMQTQVGFYSKKDSSSAGAPLLLPTPAFEKLSGMESLAGVVAGLAQKFDTTAFLWLLLQRLEEIYIL